MGSSLNYVPLGSFLKRVPDYLGDQNGSLNLVDYTHVRVLCVSYVVDSGRFWFELP